MSDPRPPRWDITRTVTPDTWRVLVTIPGGNITLTPGEAAEYAEEMNRACIPPRRCPCGEEYAPDGTDIGDRCAALAEHILDAINQQTPGGNP